MNRTAICSLLGLALASSATLAQPPADNPQPPGPPPGPPPGQVRPGQQALAPRAALFRILTPEEGKRLSEARAKAMERDEVKQARQRLEDSSKAFRRAMRDAVLEIDPGLAAAVDKIEKAGVASRGARVQPGPRVGPGAAGPRIARGGPPCLGRGPCARFGQGGRRPMLRQQFGACRPAPPWGRPGGGMSMCPPEWRGWGRRFGGVDPAFQPGPFPGGRGGPGMGPQPPFRGGRGGPGLAPGPMGGPRGPMAPGGPGMGPQRPFRGGGGPGMGPGPMGGPGAGDGPAGSPVPPPPPPPGPGGPPPSQEGGSS